jgi:hypothetical protein
MGQAPRRGGRNLFLFHSFGKSVQIAVSSVESGISAMVELNRIFMRVFFENSVGTMA